MKKHSRCFVVLLCILMFMQGKIFAVDISTLEEENSAFLNMYPKTKTFAQATFLDERIATIDRLELSSGQTGQSIVLTNKAEIGEIYQKLRGITLVRNLYQPTSSYGYVLDFYAGDKEIAGFVASAFGTLAQRINEDLAVTYRLESEAENRQFNLIVQPYFAKALFQDAGQSSSWAREPVAAACKAGLVPDRLAGSDLRMPIKRWKFSEMLTLLLERYPPKTSPKPLNDCPYEGYTYEVTAWRYGLLEGRDGGFASEDILSRQECAAILARVLTLYNISAGTGKQYNDLKAAAPWAQSAVQRCGTLFSGDKNGNFRPEDAITAEEAAIVIARIVSKIA